MLSSQSLLHTGRRLALSVAVFVVLPVILPLRAQSPAPQAVGDTLRLSVEDAVTLAQRQSDEVGIAAAQAEVAEARFGAARANALPQLRLNSTYTHVYESARGQAVGSVFNQPNTYTVNANLSQTFFQGGKLLNATRSASEMREAARFDEREQRAVVTLDVQRAYLQALYTARIAALQDTNLALASNRLAQVEQFERAGQAARYDVLRARVERANIEPLAIQAHSDAELALLDLKRVINVPITQPVVLTSSIDAGAAATVLAELADTATAIDRASIRAAERTVAARKLDISVARADYFPTVSAFIQSGYSAFPLVGQGFPTSRGTLAASFCPAGSAPDRVCQNGGFFSDQQAGINISLPLFDGFRVKSNVDLAQAQERLAELELRQQRESVALEVARARAELRRSQAVFAARRQNSAEAAEAFRLASLRFSRGLSTQLEVSDAQLALLTAESTEARATYDLFLASADLARALGQPIPLPPTVASPAQSH
jgi:outer membrane protein TolC